MNNQYQYQDPEQIRAIRHSDGPLLVAAGPGSGKTSVIISHVHYLIRQLNIRPEHILVVTFTKAAAQEMQERYLSMSSRIPAASTPRFGTMHSVFFEILKKSTPHQKYCFIKDEERNDYLKNMLIPLHSKDQKDSETEDDLIRRLTTQMSRMVNAGVQNPVSSFPQIDILPGLSGEAITHIFHSYQSFKRDHGLVDFDDILLQTWQLLTGNPRAAAYWQQKYQYILIDEFQDINELQYQCLHILEAPEGNLYAVGDEDQSIYGFRGSSPGIIKRFLDDHPGCKTITLKHNYRAPDILLEPARKLIQNNKHRTSKQITGRKELSDASYRIQPCIDQWDEYRKIAQTVRQYQSQGIPLHQQVILLRSLSLLPELLLSLQQSGIPAKAPGKTQTNSHDTLRTHFITKDIAAYLILAEENARDPYAAINPKFLLQIRHISLPHISRYTLTGENISITPQGQQELSSLKKHLTFLARLSPYPAAEYILKAMGYEQYLQTLAAQNQSCSDIYSTTLQHLKTTLRQFKTKKQFLDYLMAHNPPPNTYASNQHSKDNPDALQIQTMHSSKGLEYDVVYIPDLNKGNIPDSRAEGSGIEEERRLLYVAMTRAKRHLEMYYVKKIRGKPVFPSIFIQELQNQ